MKTNNDFLYDVGFLTVLFAGYLFIIVEIMSDMFSNEFVSGVELFCICMQWMGFSLQIVLKSMDINYERKKKMENENKLVEFDEFCKTCQYCKIDEHQEPCNECLTCPARPNSRKPINYKKEEKSNGGRKKM